MNTWLHAPLLSIVFAAGFWATAKWVSTRDVIEALYSRGKPQSPTSFPELDVWIGLLGILGGLALVLLVLSVHWLDIIDRSPRSQRRSAMRSLVVGAVFAVLLATTAWAGSFGGPRTISSLVGEEVRPLFVVIGLLLVPGFGSLAGISSAASQFPEEPSDGPGSISRLAELRRLGRTQLTAFAALLSVIVAAAAMRRQALLAFDGDMADLPIDPSGYAPIQQLDLAAEQILLYGGACAGLLGIFYLAASSALDSCAGRVAAAYAPLPSIGAADAQDSLQYRSAIDKQLGAGRVEWRGVETAVAVMSPLITAFIGTQ